MQHLKTFESFEMTNEEFKALSKLWSGAKNLFKKMVGVDAKSLAKVEAAVKEITSKPEFTKTVEDAASKIEAKPEELKKVEDKIAQFETKGANIDEESAEELSKEIEKAQAVKEQFRTALNENKRYQLINEEASIIQRMVSWISKKLGLEGVSWIIGGITLVVSAIIRYKYLYTGMNSVWWAKASASTTVLGPVGAALVLLGAVIFAVKMMIKINKGEI